MLQGCGRRGARCHPLVTPNGRGSANSTAGGRKRVFNSTCRSSWRWADGDSTWWAAGASAVARKRCHRLRLSVPKRFHKWESGSGRCKGTKSRHFRDPSTQKRSFWEFVSRAHSSLNSGSCGCKVLAQQPRRSSSDHDARPGAMTARGCSPRPPRTVNGSQVLY